MNCTDPSIHLESLCQGWDAVGRLQKRSLGATIPQLLEKLLQLLESLPWLHLEQRAAILLKSSNNDLILAAQHGFSDKRGLFCEQVPSGRCACSDALMQKQVMLRECLGEQLIEDAKSPRRHFILPLLNSDEESIGVAVLFLQASHQPTPTERFMVDKLADALSVIVSRIQLEEVVFVRQLEINESKKASLFHLGKAAEYRDSETGMHVLRMAHYAGAIARSIGLSDREREILTTAAPMHDVGKIGIPDKILLQPRRLTSSEFETMKNHAYIGWHILEGDDELMRAAREIALSHHEKWDGSGYPKGLQGETIPMLGRICSLADVFDALTSERPYKKAWTVEKAVALIQEESGTSFDPQLVKAFLDALPEVLRIKALFRDEIIDPHEKLGLPPLGEVEDVWVPWEGRYSTGIDAIDQHHQYLFRLTNNLYRVVTQHRGTREVANVIHALKQYTLIHFREEERMMQKYHYPRLEIQLGQHQYFIGKLDEFWAVFRSNPLALGFEMIYYLRDWLVNHIQQEDKRLSELAGSGRI